MSKIKIEFGTPKHFPKERTVERCIRFDHGNGQTYCWIFSKEAARINLNWCVMDRFVTEEERVQLAEIIEQSNLPETDPCYPCFKVFTDEAGKPYGLLFNDQRFHYLNIYSREKALAELARELENVEDHGINARHADKLKRQIAESGLPLKRNEDDQRVDDSIIRFVPVTTVGDDGKKHFRLVNPAAAK